MRGFDWGRLTDGLAGGLPVWALTALVLAYSIGGVR